MTKGEKQFSEDSQKVATYIKSLMGLLNISYRDLAEACDIKGRSQIYQILNSDSSMTLSTYFKLCEGLQNLNLAKGKPFEMVFFEPHEIVEKALKKG